MSKCAPASTSAGSSRLVADAHLSEVVRREGGRVLATLIRTTGDIDLAEDAVQDAALAALEAWPKTGIPDNPGAWLTTVARRKALDRIRRESSRADRETAATALLGEIEGPPPTTSMVADDTLRLIFTCCHPALSPEARLALTLRTICRLSTAEIASVFVVSEPTMAQRLSRAKRKIAVARIPYRVPSDHELPDRTAAVLTVVHALATAGHHAPSGPHVVRVDLAEEAIRLARLLAGLLHDDPEAVGLLALLLATSARTEARVDSVGDLVLLADQDRSLWDHRAIAEASGLVDSALRRRRPGRFQVQAAIACIHGQAGAWADTDWPQIVELYRLLERFEPTPVVRVNRAVAEAELHGPAAGLALLDGVEGLDGWHLLWATRGELLHRSGRDQEAASAFERAAGLAGNDADRRFLLRRIGEVTDP